MYQFSIKEVRISGDEVLVEYIRNIYGWVILHTSSDRRPSLSAHQLDGVVVLIPKKNRPIADVSADGHIKRNLRFICGPTYGKNGITIICHAARLENSHGEDLYICLDYIDEPPELRRMCQSLGRR